MVTVSKDETVKVWDSSSGECLCDHTEEGSGMWTAVRAWEGPSPPEWSPHVVATTYLGGVYVFQLVVEEGKVLVKCLNMVRPAVDEPDLSQGVPLPTEI